MSTPVRAWYEVTELARMSGLKCKVRGREYPDARRVLRTLVAEHVTIVKMGRRRVVYLTELMTKVPDLWAALQAAAELNRE